MIAYRSATQVQTVVVMQRVDDGRCRISAEYPYRTVCYTHFRVCARSVPRNSYLVSFDITGHDAQFQQYRIGDLHYRTGSEFGGVRRTSVTVEDTGGTLAAVAFQQFLRLFRQINERQAVLVRDELCTVRKIEIMVGVLCSITLFFATIDLCQCRQVVARPEVTAYRRSNNHLRAFRLCLRNHLAHIHIVLRRRAILRCAPRAITRTALLVIVSPAEDHIVPFMQ